MMDLEMALRQAASIHGPASLGFSTGTHQSLLVTQDILTEIIEEQNEKHNRASSGAGVCPFQVYSYQLSQIQRDCGGGQSKFGVTQQEQSKTAHWATVFLFFCGVQRFQRERFVTAYVNLIFFSLFLLKVLHLTRWERSKLFNSQEKIVFMVDFAHICMRYVMSSHITNRVPCTLRL